MEIKGVVHMHSTYSYDGKESLQSLRDFLMARGVSFCCLTEHTDQMTLEQAQLFVQECKMLSTSQFVFIPGFEVPYLKAHILLVGTEVFLGQFADGEMLKTWSKASSLTVLAHPVRNTFIVDDVMEQVLDGVEIWNQQYEGKLVPRQRSVRLLKSLQKKNQSLLATGGLDFHRKEHFGSPLYTIDISNLTADAILSALKKGEYSFGREGVSVSSTGFWKGDTAFKSKLQSALSIIVIVLGKKTNALLAVCGIKLPKSLKQIIRSRV